MGAVFLVSTGLFLPYLMAALSGNFGQLPYLNRRLLVQLVAISFFAIIWWVAAEQVLWRRQQIDTSREAGEITSPKNRRLVEVAVCRTLLWIVAIVIGGSALAIAVLIREQPVVTIIATFFALYAPGMSVMSHSPQPYKLRQALVTFHLGFTLLAIFSTWVVLANRGDDFYWHILAASMFGSAFYALVWWLATQPPVEEEEEHPRRNFPPGRPDLTE